VVVAPPRFVLDTRIESSALVIRQIDAPVVELHPPIGIGSDCGI
jgi:hypothetical protein